MQKDTLSQEPGIENDNPYVRLKDDALVRLMQASDPVVEKAAFSELYRRYFPIAMKLASTVLEDEENTLDAVQESFAEMLSTIETLKDPDDFAPWFYHLVIDTAIRMGKNEIDDLVIPRTLSAADGNLSQPPNGPVSDLDTYRLELVRTGFRRAISGTSEARA